MLFVYAPVRANWEPGVRVRSKPSDSCGGGCGGVAKVNPQFEHQQDNWGYEVTAKPPLDAGAKIALGALRPFVELMIELDAGDFKGSPSVGVGKTDAGSKSEL
jgi:hypothetical protein